VAGFELIISGRFWVTAKEAAVSREARSEEKANTRLAMPSAAALRIEIERALEHRFPAALTPAPKTIREVAPTGIRSVDALLEGGLPVGATSEVIGPESSGRTSLTLKFLAKRTEAEQVCAWVDAGDTFDPESAAASGVRLKQLLWVRCRNEREVTKAKPWTRLDQALRATDLLLQAAGFAAIVLDLGDMEAEHAMRIPLATWFRFRQAADRTRCSLVVLGKTAYAQSGAEVVLKSTPFQPEIVGGTVWSGCTFAVGRKRQRFMQFNASARKPPTSTWSAGAAWETGRSS